VATVGLGVSAYAIYLSKVAIEINTETTKRDQRAWVGYHKDIGRFAVGFPMTHEFGLMNTGKTPALHLRVEVNSEAVRPDKMWGPTCTSEPQLRGGPSISTLPPGAEKSVVSTYPLPLEAIAAKAIADEQIIFYMFGFATYDDIFGQPHLTTFCVFLKPDLSGTGDCPSYNDSN